MKRLEDDEITAARITRRSALAAIGAIVLGASSVRAQAVSDRDRSDAPGRGYTGRTDSDTGPSADRSGHGRTGPGGCTDSDAGSYADEAGRGRCRECSDSDGGRYGDPPGRGRRCG